MSAPDVAAIAMTLDPARTRIIPPSDGYSGLFAYRTHGAAPDPDRREIVAYGVGAEEAVRQRVEAQDGAS